MWEAQMGTLRKHWKGEKEMAMEETKSSKRVKGNKRRTTLRGQRRSLVVKDKRIFPKLIQNQSQGRIYLGGIPKNEYNQK